MTRTIPIQATIPISMIDWYQQCSRSDFLWLHHRLGLSAAALLGSLLGLPYNRAIVNTANSVSFLGKVPPTLVSTAHELLPWEGLGGRLYPTHCLSSATSAVPSTVAPVDLSIQ